MTIRKPPPGYEAHPIIPGLIRKLPARTAAQAIYPYLPTAQPPAPKVTDERKQWGKR
jgi:hypothetical protein